jgi:dihydrofolate synthase/folylpolyglutamate synthase
LGTLGCPQRQFPSILVVGTNGKGSTVAMLSSVLGAHGLSVGRYTSPHLIRVEERIQVDGHAIDRADLERHLARLEPFADLTFFEVLTAAALLHCAEHDVDCAVLEAGMGGRWDATRLAGSVVAGLTNIGTDHQRWLGTSRESIAADKGQALASAAIAVLGPDVDAAIVHHLGAGRARAAAELVELGGSGSTVEARWGPSAITVEPVLPGAHQISNLHLALALGRAAAEVGLIPSLQPEAVLRGLAAVQWPGRLSRHTIGDRRVLIDCAHNLEGATALAQHLAGLPERHHLLFSCLDDKPVEAMAAVLEPAVESVAVCPLDDDRAMDTGRMRAAFSIAQTAPGPLAGVELLPRPIVAAGSLRLAAALLEASS